MILFSRKIAVVNVDAVAVRDDPDVNGVGHVVPEEHAVADFEILEGPTTPIDAVETVLDARSRTLQRPADRGT